MCDSIGDFAEPFDFCTESQPTARKQYRCDCCRGSINKGETYLKHTSKFEGEISTERMCAGCFVDWAVFVREHQFFTSPSNAPDMYYECVYSRHDFRSMLRWKRALRKIDKRREEARIK